MSDTDRDLYESAISDAPVETTVPETVKEAVTEVPVVEGDQPRDVTGKWLPKVDAEQIEAKPAKVKPEAKPAEQPNPDNDKAAIPSWRLREVRERAEAAEQRAIAAEQRAAQIMAQFQQQQKPQEPPDFYVDPNAAFQHHVDPIKRELGQELMQMKLNFSGALAAQQYGEESVKTAQSDIEQQVRQNGQNDPDYQRIMRSPHPYGELMKWHKQVQTRQKIGDDLDGFLAKRDEGLLDDPAFMAKVAERLRSQNGNGAARPAANVKLPPSLSRVTSAAPRTSDGDDDVSDAGLYRHATR